MRLFLTFRGAAPVLLLLAACQSVEVAESRELVYISAQAVQCEFSGHPAQVTAQALEDAGVAVAESQCAFLTDVMYPAVCGGGSGGINVHAIASSDLEKALALGYKPVSELKVEKRAGYEVQDCKGRGRRMDSSS